MMATPRAWRLKVVGLVVAMLAPLAAWQGYKGIVNSLGEARAQGRFIGGVPHFKCYVITPGTALNEPVTLFDQFHGIEAAPTVPGQPPAGGESVVVRAPSLVCTPVSEKCRTADSVTRCEVFGDDPPVAVEDHLKCYDITPSGPPVNQAVTMFDQFHPMTGPPPSGSTIPQGGESVTVRTPQFLCAPATKCIAGQRCGGSPM